MSKGLSKSKIMYWVQCPKRLYLSVHNPDLAEPFSGPSIGWGVDLGETARTLWTDGILIEHVDNPRQALLETRQALESDDPKNVMFEAAFSHDGVLVRGDVFMQQSGKNQLVEVKGSTSVHQHYLTDSAIQAWVIDLITLPVIREVFTNTHTSLIIGHRFSKCTFFMRFCVLGARAAC